MTNVKIVNFEKKNANSRIVRNRGELGAPKFLHHFYIKL